MLMSVEALLNYYENRIEELKANSNNLCYWVDCGDGGYWKTLTDESVEKLQTHLKLDMIKVKNIL